MGHFVANEHANGAIVNGIIGAIVKKGILHQPGGKNDLVKNRIVVCIYGGRRHAPFAAVDPFVYFSQHLAVIVFSYIPLVFVKRIFSYVHITIILPFIGIADLLG